MSRHLLIAAFGVAVVVAMVLTVSPAARQAPAILTMDEQTLGQFAGVYRSGPDAFLYLQLWDEFAGFGKPPQLVAFDESGEVRVLYPTGGDRFFAGPGAAVPGAVEAHVAFQRDARGRITSLTWTRDGRPARTARRVETEARHEVEFSNGAVRLAGTLISPVRGRRHPAVILVHGSGAENRDYVLPYARFLIRHGITVFGYDKRGVGGSTGDWHSASFDDLAGDVSRAFDYLKTRPDIDDSAIGLLGVSQAGWIMPIAAVRSPGIAFLISVSGAAVSPEETTLDEASNEMSASGMQPAAIAQILELMRRQYRYARTNEGWEEYLALRQQIAARIGGTPPPQFPADRDDPIWQAMRATYFYDPGPTLRQLRTPTLALFGALDDNILPQKNRAAWDAALKAGGNRDYTLIILPNANHSQWRATLGTIAEEPTLQGFVPEYFSTVRDWLAKRVPNFH